MDALIGNDVLQTCVLAWIVAQFSKPLIHYVHSRRLNLRYFVTAGGMPSSHSAVSAVCRFSRLVMALLPTTTCGPVARSREA